MYEANVAIWALSAHLLATGLGHAAGLAERPPQEELHLCVDAAEVVRGPASQGVEDLGVQTQEKGLPLAHV